MRLEITESTPEKSLLLPGVVVAMIGYKRTANVQWFPRGQNAEEERLDRALVTGLMLEVILETSALKKDPAIHRTLVKARLKNLIVTHLAGRVTLKRFHSLLREIDHCFPQYYQLIASGSLPARASATPPPQAVAAPPPAPAGPQMLREDRLQNWLEHEIRKLLPQRPHRKLGPKRLLEFLLGTRGGWFKLKDFERYFEVDRKTAWEYLQKFLSAGLLCHNHRRSAAVRYALAARFLVVLAETLKPKVREALPELPQGQADRVCDWLAATSGEPFPETAWHCHLEPAQCRDLIGTLQAAGLLKELGPHGENPQFQLSRRVLLG